MLCLHSNVSLLPAIYSTCGLLSYLPTGMGMSMTFQMLASLLTELGGPLSNLIK